MTTTALALLAQALNAVKAENAAIADDHNLAAGLRIKQAADLLVERDRQQKARADADVAATTPTKATRKSR